MRRIKEGFGLETSAGVWGMSGGMIMAVLEGVDHRNEGRKG
jgi:hypothetical protein